MGLGELGLGLAKVVMAEVFAGVEELALRISSSPFSNSFWLCFVSLLVNWVLIVFVIFAPNSLSM